MDVTINLAIAKTHKFGNRDSGDSAEVVERPGGGFSVVVVDGQGTGAQAKRLSLAVAGRAVTLLNEGVRDGVVARATHDFLYALRDGRVSAELDIISVDLASATVLFTRNSEVPMVVWQQGSLRLMRESGGRIGIYRHTRPKVLEFPAEPGLVALVVTDGVINAGQRWGSPFVLDQLAGSLITGTASASALADGVLQGAMAADHGRPNDDMTVVALSLGHGVHEQPVRRIVMSVPLPI